MIGNLKRQIRKQLEKKYEKRYRRLWKEQTASYDSHIKALEAQAGRKDDLSRREAKAAGKAVVFLAFDELDEGEEVWQDRTEEIVCFVENREWVREGTAGILEALFEENPQIQVIYADEDECNREGNARMNPWFKPEYSPDTLLSYFYFGSLVAIRRSSLEEVSVAKGRTNLKALNGAAGSTTKTCRQKLYALILQVCFRLKREQIYHCPRILTTSPAITYWGFEEEYEGVKAEYERLLPKRSVQGVSIIIPSRDNPEILRQCIESIVRFSQDTDYEILVVDNGSGEENVSRIERLGQEYGFCCIYQPMEFNFSRMCNLGAAQSKKDLLLFLNDDCQAIEPGWLKRLGEAAACSHVGAVGSKLLYPKSKTIQHCGVYGLYLGPVHKLQFKEDSRVYYDRRNRGIRNVLAVTGACLMVRREVFLQAEGFSEKLQVAFNDIDFCWRLYELGYDNVIHNEVRLWHHESLSRGSDEGEEKLSRLIKEKRLLYERHPGLWNRDPYYHREFTDVILDVNFSFNYEYNKGFREVLEPIKMKRLPRKLRWDDCVSPTLEYAGRAADWWLDGDDRKDKLLYFQGNCLVPGSNNACFKIEILLENDTGQRYRISPSRRYRPDVAVNVTDQINVDLSGFSCLVKTDSLPYGTYQILFLAKDLCSGQYLLRRTGRKITHNPAENGKDE